MQRRLFVAAGAFVALRPAYAHHGWSGFDTTKPLWLEGRALRVAWRNPHAEFELQPAGDLRVPEDLARRRLPAQTSAVDGPGLLAEARVPERRAAMWRVELAPLSRLQAWQVEEIKPGDSVAVLGYTTSTPRDEPVLRAEYLFVGDKVYGLRSSPA
ncbi:DUF6152 family protein [Rubrivivax gelatinosus]|uniref:Uncharacterized protein n=1 Tax=Rubrivivax gelatinosus TaxID=28068 RepID=A0A4R2M835_RUBGE|nr:DUF6152 family protein [Rubrivivax gelatinosus]MBK1687054.1 hypothetical protein [Rubrivivax gelatinosus]TCP00567.1 hypothetical protein EV684_1123 [Rubrivivax gelatinosus]